MMEKILLVEDDESLGPSLEKYLLQEGYEVKLSTTLEDASNHFKLGYNLIILDWMLPDGQGLDLLKKMRAEAVNVPVIMLTARADLIDKVIGLESGANDYMTKPFEPRELIARVRVQLRTKSTPLQVDNKSISLKGIDFNFEKREVHYGGKVIELTKMEYELLKLLLVSPGKAFSREEILNKVWGYENYPTTRTVDTHVLQLRQKFWDEMIETIRGVGYRFNE